MFWVTICVSSRWSFGVLKKKVFIITAAGRDFNRRKLCIFAQQNNQSYEHYIHFISNNRTKQQLSILKVKCLLSSFCKGEHNKQND